MTKTFYCDKETYALLDEARKKDPNFNLSGFIKNSLLGISDQSKELDIDFIKQNLDKLELTIKQAENEIEFWKGKELQYHVQEEQKKQKIEEERLVKEMIDKKHADKLRNIKQAFLEEMNREMTEFELEEYFKSSINIWAFCESLKKDA